MEGKACLFKKFADIDVFDLEVDARDSTRFIDTVAALEPTFGGINLEDLKAPECFEIEEGLRARMSIPVFHDDQHGTAIISGAALMNGAEIAGKKLADLQDRRSRAPAPRRSPAPTSTSSSACRSRTSRWSTRVGVIYAGRDQGMNPYKARFARKDDGAPHARRRDARRRRVPRAVEAGAVHARDAARRWRRSRSSSRSPTPIPRSATTDAKAARPDAIVATGRSDFPNQVNNVLGFPYIFRGALDVRAKEINEAMKIAAARALAELAHEPVPDSVAEAYGGARFASAPTTSSPSRSTRACCGGARRRSPRRR